MILQNVEPPSGLKSVENQSRILEADSAINCDVEAIHHFIGACVLGGVAQMVNWPFNIFLGGLVIIKIVQIINISCVAKINNYSPSVNTNAMTQVTVRDLDIPCVAQCSRVTQ